MSDDPDPGTPDPVDETPIEEIVEAEVVDASPEQQLELPEDPAEAVPVLISELMAARSVAGEAMNNWQRTAAEFDNFRKRAERDQESLIARSSVRVVTQLLPVLDGLDAAMGLDAETETESKMLSGMAGTRELLLTTLASEGVEPIDALGADFDPALHEAVQVAEGSGTMIVSAEFRRGYTVRGKVLRATLVSVGYVDGEADSEEPA